MSEIVDVRAGRLAKDLRISVQSPPHKVAKRCPVHRALMRAIRIHVAAI